MNKPPAGLRRQIDRLVDALVDGTPASAVKDRLAVLEHRRMVLEEALATAVAPAPRLHANLAEYRRQFAALADLLGYEDGTEAREMVRGLVEPILLVPEDDRLRMAVLGLAEDAGWRFVLADQDGCGDRKSPTVDSGAREMLRDMNANP